MNAKNAPGLARLFFGLAVMVFGSGVVDGRASAADAAPAPAEAQLQSTTIFSFGGIGFAGTTSSGELAFRELLKRKRAADLFGTVFEHATPEGRCYALVALRELSPPLFKQCARSFRKNPPKQVTMMNGCIMRQAPGHEVMAAIEAGYYRGVVE